MNITCSKARSRSESRTRGAACVGLLRVENPTLDPAEVAKRRRRASTQKITVATPSVTCVFFYHSGYARRSPNQAVTRERRFDPNTNAGVCLRSNRTCAHVVSTNTATCASFRPVLYASARLWLVARSRPARMPNRGRYEFLQKSSSPERYRILDGASRAQLPDS